MKENTNELINELYKTLDAKDNIINQQALEIAELKENITWWQNRFNAVARDYAKQTKEIDKLHNALNGKITKFKNNEFDKLQQRIDKAIEYIKDNYLYYYDRLDDYNLKLRYLDDISKLNELLGDKENE